MQLAGTTTKCSLKIRLVFDKLFNEKSQNAPETKPRALLPTPYLVTLKSLQANTLLF